MLRSYILFLLAAAFLASFLSSGGDPVPERPPTEGQGAIAVESEPSDDGFSQDANSGDIEIRRSADGHFYADVTINGITVNILVDTGATGIALTRDDARRVGLAVAARMDQVIGRGASGDVRGEYVRLDRVALGGASAEAVPAVVLDTGHQSLLGQSFLQEFQSVEIQGDKMLLR